MIQTLEKDTPVAVMGAAKISAHITFFFFWIAQKIITSLLVK